MELNRREAVVLALSSVVGFRAWSSTEVQGAEHEPAVRAVRDDRFARDVTIYRDLYGVPHIVGETEEAAFFGYGYAQAEDHLERMMLQYRDAQGRRAEIQGFEALGDGYLHFIPYEYRWDGDYLQRLMRTKQGVVENREKSVYAFCEAHHLPIMIHPGATFVRTSLAMRSNNAGSPPSCR